MRIKKLELVGFKSFKDRTVIHFDEGITGIVGPNGCGKSNIVDALIWVMGEMSAKHLRGSSMEDVIFAGAEGYAPIGMAEVSLILENEGGPFPAKFLRHSEIMITRRLYRSGESEYLINKEPARLKDIQEIFMDTGAGSKGFSIIEQGAIGKIITSRPDERRVLIEEAAGITKFKVRKKESLRKLVATDQNLIRLADIVGELKSQLESLSRQAQKAERFRKIKKEIEQMDLWLSTQSYVEIENSTQQSHTFYQEAQEKWLEQESFYHQKEATITENRLFYTEKEKEISDLQYKLSHQQNETQKLEVLIRELRFEIEQAKRNKEMTGSLTEEQMVRRDILRRDKESLENKEKNLNDQLNEVVLKYEEKNENFESIQVKIEELDEELTHKRKELFTLSQSGSHVEAHLSAELGRTNEITERLNQCRSVMDELLIKKDEFEKRRNLVFRELEGEKQMQLDIMKDVENFETNRVILQDKIDSHRLDLEAFKDSHNEVSSRLYGLENMQSNFEGFEDGVKNVMLWQKENNKPNYLPMANILEVPHEYEVAMEAALGTRLQMLVSKHEEDSLNALEYLKKKGSGRSSFCSLNLMTHSELDVEKNRTPSNIRTLLGSVVNTSDEYKSVIDSLLNEVAVVDSLREALKLRQDYPSWTFVTLDGDVISPDGIITGGSSESAQSGMLQRRREIKELTVKKEEFAGKVSLLQLSLEKFELQLKGVSQDLEKSKQASSEKEIRLSLLKKDLEQAEAELRNVIKAIERQEKEITSIEQEKESRVLKCQELEKKYQELSLKKKNIEEEVTQIEQNLNSSRIGTSELQEEVMELKVKVATLTKELEVESNQLRNTFISLEEIESKLSKMEFETQKNSDAIHSNQILLEEKKVEFERLVSECQHLAKELSSLRNEFEKFSTFCRESEAGLSQIISLKNELQLQMNESKLKFEQMQLKKQYLMDQVMERYQIVLTDVVDQYKNQLGDKDKFEEELKENRAKLLKIGDVNLSAISEYEEVSKRYEFLSKQQNDLINAKDQLKKVIDKINRICSKRFKETFDLVNERFQKVFPVLFGGGEAKLLLIEAEDKEELGIDIVAKPPGKKMQSVTLMSGGEKALTAVALIFSIFLVKPSPYCLLDEVDAPLDDANVQRFNDLVREMSKRSQIILVTHNKYTMEINKRLYGVTMEEKGVSKMVSVSLEDAQKVVGIA